MAQSVGSVFLEVVPSVANFASLLRSKTLDDIKKVGQQAGQDFGDALSGGSAASLEKLKSQLADAALATERASVQVATAHTNAANAAGKVQVAESNLATVRQKAASDAANVVSAEQKLEEARATAGEGSTAVMQAEQALESARNKAASSSTQVVRAEQSLEFAKRNVELQDGKTTLAESELTAAQDKQAISAKALQEAQDKQGGTLQSVAGTLGKVGLAMTSVAAVTAGVAVNSAADYQQQLDRLVTTAGESQQNIAAVGQGMLQMAGQVGTSTTDLANGMYTVESAGYHGADGLAVLKASAQGAKEENADLSTVTNAVTDVLTDYHLKATDAADVTSKLITAVSLGKTNFEDLSGAMSSVAPVASASHISLQDLLGDMAEMTSHGVSADQAAQNLANTIRSLANPTNVMTQELSALGINSSDLSKNLGQTGVSGAVEQISTAIMQHMGPAGTTLLSSFNQSKIAAQDANTALKALPANLQSLATQFEAGKISTTDWRNALKALPADQANLLTQWSSMENKSKGFSNTLTSGSTAAQTYTQALAKATGNATSMNVALMLTGENANSTSADIAKVAGATADASGNTQGWADVQNQFNLKLAQAKDGFQAMMISIGQSLLPTATKLLGVFGSMGSFLGQNTGLVKLMLGVVGGLGSAFLLAAGAVKAWTVATDLAKAAQLAYQIVTRSTTAAVVAENAATDANPIVLIVMAIVAAVAVLAFGIYELVTHWKQVWGAISDAASAVYHAVIKPVFDGIGTAVKAVGNWFASAWQDDIHPAIDAVGAGAAWLYNNAIKPAGEGISIAVRAIGSTFQWLWSNIISPVLNFIAEAATITAKVILAIFLAPIVLAVKGLGAIFNWLWGVAIKPALDAIVTAFKVTVDAYEAGWCGLRDNVLKPIADFFVNIVWHDGVEAATNWISDKWKWLREVFDIECDIIKKNVLNPLVDFFVNIVWHNGIEAAIKWISDKWQWLREIFDAECMIIQNKVLNPLVDFFVNDLWHNGIERGLNSMSDGFKTAVSVIGRVWDDLKRAFGTPIEFVIRTVLNNGIIKGINWVLSQVNISGIPNIPDPNLPTFATGGIAQGGTRGRDSILAWLMPDEGVLVPEAVAGIGGPGMIHALNAHFGGGGGPTINSGLPGFSLGGVVDGLLNGIGDAASSAWNGLKDVVLGGLQAAAQGFFGGVVNPLIGQIPGGANSVARKALVGMSNKAETGILSFLGAKDKAALASLGGVVPSGQHLAVIDAALQADGIAKGQWAMWEAGLNTLIQRESGWNASAVNNWDSNAKAGIPSTGLAQVVAPTFAAYRNRSLANSLTDPVANVAAAVNYILSRYGSISNVQQANANLPPRGYDDGGYLMPGRTQVVNATGRPEPVFTSSQWDVLRGNLNRSQEAGGEHHYHVTTTDPVAVATEIERRQRLLLTAKL